MKIKVKVKSKETEYKPLYIDTPFITLDNVLKFSGIAETGGHAKLLIQDGCVYVNGEVCLMRGKKLKEGDTFKFENEAYEVRVK